MRLHLPDDNSPVGDLAKEIIAIFERRRVPPPVAMTVLTEAMVVAVSMVPVSARREVVAKLNAALRDNIDFVTKAGL